MPKKKKILKAVFFAIDEVNLQIPAERRINKSEAALLIGDSANLESVELVSLIVAVEQEIENAFHREISLTDNTDEIFDLNGPLHTVETLVDYIANLMEV
jgi:acyl carrier protein